VPSKMKYTVQGDAIKFKIASGISIASKVAVLTLNVTVVMAS
jgi:hypothetical protein